MDNIKKFIDCYIPTETCNLRCHYCYITQQRKFNNKLASFSKSKETIRKALSKERWGGTCLINICAGGETLLSDEVLPIVKELLEEGHYVMIVTNGTMTKRFKEIAQWPKELNCRLLFKFSFHFLELERLNWFDMYFSNVKMMREAGASVTVEITPSDELIPRIPDVQKTCQEYLGAMCHVTIARDDRTNGIDILSNLDFDEYTKIWGVFKSDMFDFKKSIFYQHRDEFCYAGEWSVFLNLETGDMKQCYGGKHLDNIYSNIDEPLYCEAVNHRCPLAHCYNGHAFLTLGVIPELDTITFAETRNRVCEDGSEWLTSEMKAFISGKLKENNKEYSLFQKYRLRRKNDNKSIRQYLYRVKRRLMTGKRGFNEK